MDFHILYPITPLLELKLRDESNLDKLSELVRATDADGVVDAAAAAHGFVGMEGPSVHSVVVFFSIIAWAIE
jgi:hypothetical protein